MRGGLRMYPSSNVVSKVNGSGSGGMTLKCRVVLALEVGRNSAGVSDKQGRISVALLANSSVILDVVFGLTLHGGTVRREAEMCAGRGIVLGEKRCAQIEESG